MRRSRGGRGAALVTVLVTGLALLLLALAGATLALLHLQTARHAERTQRARIAARSGLELVDALLAHRVAMEGRLPEAAPALPPGHDLDAAVTGYERLHDRAAEVEVRARDAAAVATAGGRLHYP